MRILRKIFFFALLAYMVLFCVYNFTKTPVTIPFIAEIESLPLFVVIIICLIIGIILGGIMSNLSKKSTSPLKRENKQLKKKLDLYETESSIQKDAALQNRITDN